MRKRLRDINKRTLSTPELLPMIAEAWRARTEPRWRLLHQQALRTGSVPIPQDITFEATSRCNLDCKMCFESKEFRTRKVSELTPAHIRRIFDGFPRIKSVVLVGGEPFVRRDIGRIAAYFLYRGARLSFCTNGTLLPDESADWLYSNLDGITVMLSVDGPKEVHNAVRGQAWSFDRVARGARALRSAGGKPIVVCVILEDNLARLEEMPRVAAEMGARHLFLEYERRYGRSDIEESKALLGEEDGFEDISVSEFPAPSYSYRKLRACVDAAEREAARHGVHISYLPESFKRDMPRVYSRSMRADGRYVCTHLARARIDPQGNVIHCFAVRKKFGNLLRSSFRDIWESSAYREFRKRLLRVNLLPVCEGCLCLQRIDSNSSKIPLNMLGAP